MAKDNTPHKLADKTVISNFAKTCLSCRHFFSTDASYVYYNVLSILCFQYFPMTIDYNGLNNFNMQ